MTSFLYVGKLLIKFKYVISLYRFIYSLFKITLQFIKSYKNQFKTFSDKGSLSETSIPSAK